MITAVTVAIKIVCPLGKLDAAGCSVTRSTSAVVGLARRTRWLSTTYQAPLIAPAPATIQARRFQIRTATNTRASTTAPFASPIQLKAGNASASGPQSVACTSRSIVTSTGGMGCMTMIAVMIPAAAAAASATARNRPRIMRSAGRVPETTGRSATATTAPEATARMPTSRSRASRRPKRRSASGPRPTPWRDT